MAEKEVIEKLKSLISGKKYSVELISITELSNVFKIPKKDIIRLWCSGIKSINGNDYDDILKMFSEILLPLEVCTYIITRYYTESPDLK